MIPTTFICNIFLSDFWKNIAILKNVSINKFSERTKIPQLLSHLTDFENKDYYLQNSAT